MTRDLDAENIILEFVQLGPLVRVSAMDPGTLTEVVIQGPASAGEAELRRAVVRKLAYVLERRSNGGFAFSPARKASRPENTRSAGIRCRTRP